MNTSAIIQLIIEQIDDSFTWINFSQTCKHAYRLCQLLIVYKNNRYWKWSILPSGTKHGFFYQQKMINNTSGNMQAQVETSGYFVNDRKHGSLYQKFSRRGICYKKVYWSVRYGVFDGSCYTYRPNLNFKSHRQYQGNKLNGPFRAWHYDHLVKYCMYNNDHIHGLCINWFSPGPRVILKHICQSQHGILHGVYRDWYITEAGKNRISPNDRHGVQHDFYFFQGQLHGPQLYYDSHGRMTRMDIYVHGVLIAT